MTVSFTDNTIHSFRQFSRQKFVATAPDVLPLDFFWYQGKSDKMLENDKFNYLDISGKPVMKLSKTLSLGVTICIDRYLYSVPLLHPLHNEVEYQGTGTVQKGRIHCNWALKPDALMKKTRQSLHQVVRNGGQIVVVKWYSNIPVTFVSSKEASYPMDMCERKKKKEKKYEEI